MHEAFFGQIEQDLVISKETIKVTFRQRIYKNIQVYLGFRCSLEKFFFFLLHCVCQRFLIHSSSSFVYC